ncbi:DUF3558 domain-containing protein [Crossiella cryophila]|uniref:DUF3558 domain-containing protein n=1 Tax=Crossiella cryophila TaxID=43355 RepID=A0A7W7CJG5_9PSEU|nr:hypothetical protein [Crossiella cryophila]MBB4682290.1 hypothetical protein [Crossiella cryophila]
MAARAVLACVVLVTVLVGCGTPQAGPGAAAPAPDWPRLDPCSLLAPDALSRFGGQSAGPELNFDDCRLALRNGVAELTVTLGSGGRLAEAHGAEQLGFELVERDGVRVGRAKAVADSCGSVVVLPDLRYVTVDVSGEDAQLCAVAEAAAESVRTVLRTGGTRSRAYPRNSLAALDPCPLVPAALAARVPGIDTPMPHGDGNRHVCQWGGRRGDSPSLLVSFSVVDPDPAAPAAIERIGGRESLVRAQPAGGGLLPSCRVDTRHIAFGQGYRENARVSIYSALPAEENCPLAREVATAVWPRLPAL